MTRWTVDQIPDQSGRIVLVTGANSGLGFQTSRALARAGARVLMGCRDQQRADRAFDDIKSEVPEAQIEIVSLDLASLDSVRAAASDVANRTDRLDVLVNNAGVMAIPRHETADGFEMQFGTNHLGHFALTGLLLDRILRAPSSRIVTVSSNAHRAGRMNFADLQGARTYRRWLAYGQSKLSNLLFAYELQRRLEASGESTISVAAHPGFAATHLQAVGPEMTGRRLVGRVMALGNRLLAQSDEQGALPQLYAATAPDVRGGEYFGPSGLAEQRGHPKRVRSNRRSHDAEAARRLWQISEELTGITYGLRAAA